MKLATYRIDAGHQDARTGGTPELDAWQVRFGDRMLVYAADNKWRGMARDADRRGLELEEQPGSVRKGDLYLVVQKGRLFQQAYPDVRVLLDKGRYLAVELSAEQIDRIGDHPEPCFVVQPLREDTVVFDQRPPAAARAARQPWLEALVAGVDGGRYHSALEQLVALPTRFSTSDHYVTAADWCREQLAGMGYAARLEAVALGNAGSHNVIADRPGAGAGQRGLVLVTAHLDSINSSGGPTAPAPGADDNGSGSAALLTLAGALKDHRSVHDLCLILFGGEEQGLHGSRQYVAALDAAERGRIRAVVNMDMVGSRNTAAPTVLLEGAEVSREVIEQLAEAAASHTTLTVQTSFNPFASDHVPFIEAGLPAVLTIEGADSANDRIHSADDTLEHLDDELALDIIRMNTGFVAGRLERHADCPEPEGPQPPAPPSPEQFSGRYSHNGGAGRGHGLSAAELAEQPPPTVRNNPLYKLRQPIYRGDTARDGDEVRFTLHVDIDGIDPLNVVSGTLAGAEPGHFIGRVSADTPTGDGRRLVVEDFRLRWPLTGETIERLEVNLIGPLAQPRAQVHFIAAGSDFGPFTAVRESAWYRDIEFEIDREDGAVEIEPYDSLTHPDRPADLIRENLTLESTFARSGIRISRSPQGNVIDTREAGANQRWNELELHDAMETHWNAFANRPQWKLWIFMANLAERDGLGGIMFDGDINEPGGVDRQGTAIFTKEPFFHSVEGGYIKANPPEAEAVRRELFFNLIHEAGHAFNLAHSFQKTLGGPWQPPQWLPLASDPRALSWMNYPDQASPGLNASWFYERFRFRFDDGENLFLRHAPEHFVQMGAEDWFENHGRVARGSLDRRLELTLRGLKTLLELGEPAIIELKLKNISAEPVPMHANLDPGDGYVELAVTDPGGQRRPFLPFAHARSRVITKLLEPGQALYASINLTMGHFGCPFKEPGPYRIEAGYHNLDGSSAAAVMRLWIKPPVSFDDWPVLSEFFNARVGRVLSVGGSRVMEDVNDLLGWIAGRLGERHPVQYHLARILGSPLALPFKLLPAGTDRIRLLDPDPERVQHTLQPVVDDTSEAADTIGHIEYRRVVDTYTECALQARHPAAARKAQDVLLGLFKKRQVIRPVIEAIQHRIRRLK